MNAKNPESLAIIGSGASVVFLLKHIYDRVALLTSIWNELIIFEKGSFVGAGMPYNPETTDSYNLSNISSEEIPELKISFANWLKRQKANQLNDWGIIKDTITEKKVYSRLALGAYLHAQFKELVADIELKGIKVSIHNNTRVTDIKDIPTENNINITTSKGRTFVFNNVLIATGHHWPEQDDLINGYFKSPWPIAKILPPSQTYYNVTIGILGASLSAVDVVTSLAHRHGTFEKAHGKLRFNLAKEANKFKIVMHDASGWLPNLQYEQKEPLRKIYRHTDRKTLFSLLDKNGYLRLETYFEVICKPVLKNAFLANNFLDLAKLMSNSDLKLNDFIKEMSERHHYDNAFEGMRTDMVFANEALKEDIPIFWKEALDDLIFTLNWHAELLPAEDHVYFHEKVFPFLMNVITALPLVSAEIILALYDARVLDLVAGEITEIVSENKKTTITVKQKKNVINLTYRMFIECGGDPTMNAKNYPFQSLVTYNNVRAPRVGYADEKINSETLKNDERMFRQNNRFFRELDGIDIDPGFRVINNNGKANNRIFDLTFTHLSGLRPYSYGLQACHATAAIFISSILEYGKAMPHDPLTLEEVSKLYTAI